APPAFVAEGSVAMWVPTPSVQPLPTGVATVVNPIMTNVGAPAAGARTRNSTLPPGTGRPSSDRSAWIPLPQPAVPRAAPAGDGPSTQRSAVAPYGPISGGSARMRPRRASLTAAAPGVNGSELGTWLQVAPFHCQALPASNRSALPVTGSCALAGSPSSGAPVVARCCQVPLHS